MELEFDKEMDALLRKARTGTIAGKPRGKHLDADVIAAFAEGAIPDAARKTYTAHFADCDSCRKTLSRVALLNEPIAVAATAGAAPTVAAPARATAPWYRSLFRTPGLAAAFGILVIAFAAGLIYLVTQRGSSPEASVAFDTNKASANAIPYAGIDTNSSANAANAVSNTMTMAANSANSASRSAANSNAATAKSTNEPISAPEGSTTTSTVANPSGGLAASQPPRAAAPAPPTVDGRDDTSGKVADEKTKTGTDEPRDKDLKKEAPRSRALSEDSLARGDTAERKAAGGPLRNAGPVQNQVQSNVMNGEMPVTRKVGGKTFHNTNGAWYDNAYHGQATTDVRRSTDDFKKLDSGLRSIANDLGGVVVVVWKDKAYRIQ